MSISLTFTTKVTSLYNFLLQIKTIKMKKKKKFYHQFAILGIKGLINSTNSITVTDKNNILTLFSSTGHRPASLCHGLLSAVSPSVRVLTFLNIFSETTHQILMKFHRNVPAMVLFKIS